MYFLESHIILCCTYLSVRDIIHLLQCNKQLYSFYSNKLLWLNKNYEIDVASFVRKIEAYTFFKKCINRLYPPLTNLTVNFEQTNNQETKFIFEYIKVHLTAVKHLHIINKLCIERINYTHIQLLDLQSLTFENEYKSFVWNFAWIKNMSLRELDMSRLNTNSMYAEQNINYLTTLTSLESLRIVKSHVVSGDWLYDVSKMTQLKTLVLANPKNLIFSGLITDRGLNNISKLSLLRKLVIYNVRDKIDENKLVCFKNMSQLEILKLSGFCTITDRIFEHISELTSLKKLALKECARITGWEMSTLNVLENLYHIDLSDNRQIGTYIYEKASHLSSLKVLVLRGCSLSMTDNMHYKIIT